MTRFAILLGGNLTVTKRLRRQIAGARVIAADSGMAHAAALNLEPELWVGDFDSAGSELVIAFAQVPRETHPAEKDRTDGAIAVASAAARGASETILVGGFGGQSDHLLGHFGLLLQLAQGGCRALMTSGDEEAHPVLPGQSLIDSPPGTRISLFPFSALEGLDLAGVKWPLHDRSVPFGSTLTLSNLAHGPVRIGLRSGLAIAVLYPVPENV